MLPLPWCPVEEQRLIVEYISARSVPLDEAQARLEREIELIREYRVGLVAEVVTGKLDVREAAAQFPDDVGEDPELLAEEATEA